jgi:hypothetical protein
VHHRIASQICADFLDDRLFVSVLLMKGESSLLLKAIEGRIWRVEEINNLLNSDNGDDCSRSDVLALLRQLLSEARGLQLQLLKLEKVRPSVFSIMAVRPRSVI